MKNRRILFTLAAAGCFTLGGSLVYFTQEASTRTNVVVEKAEKNLADIALLAIIKNDLPAFKSVIESQVHVHDLLPAIDGRALSISEGIAHFERIEFLEFLQQKKISFIQAETKNDYDILSITVGKNNPEMMKLLLKEKPSLEKKYGTQGWSLLHMASAKCSHKLVSLLHEEGNLSWDLKAKDGSTPLTLAAQADCLPVLSYWKEQKANFVAKDGRGLTALSILRQKKDAALAAFAASFEVRKTASVKAEIPNFYKKRVIPKEKRVDYSTMIEPEERPLDANETADFSEFSD
jgi:hypothetical protein